MNSLFKKRGLQSLLVQVRGGLTGFYAAKICDVSTSTNHKAALKFPEESQVVTYGRGV